MPCSDWSEYDRIATPELRVSEREVERLTEKVHFLTAQLCWAMNEVDNYGASAVPAELERWWKEHKMLDERRRQEVKKAALAKLTPEERELLGLTA
jgi:hypothetical protein